jgi:hypothetical protein
MSMYEASEILDMATEGIPEDIMDNEKVEQAFAVVFDWLDKLTDWIDPESEHYAQDIYESRREGAVSVAERYRIMLEEALYRQDLFGEQFDLRAFVERLSTITLDEVLEEAR